MKIMILGHRGHGKTTVAKILEKHFYFSFVDTTVKVCNIARHFLRNNEDTEYAVGNCEVNEHNFDSFYTKNKDSVRDIMKSALRDYTKDDPARLIREQFMVCDTYAGCRSQIEYDSAKELIDLTLWIKDDRKLEDDPTMDIQLDDSMIVINNSGSIMQLERNIKGVLCELAGLEINFFDKTIRDYIVSNMKSTQKHKNRNY